MPTKKEEPKEEMTLEAALEMMKALQARQDELEKNLAAKDEHIAQQQSKISNLEQRDEGWLVWSKNPMYDGAIKGIRFQSGAAFILKEAEYPGWKPEPLKKTQLDQLDEEARKKHDEIQAQPSSWHAVQKLVADFGYRSKFYDTDHLPDLQDFYEERAELRADAEEREKEAEEVRKLSVSHLVR